MLSYRLPADVREDTVKVEGLRTRVLSAGAGPAVVLFHGLGDWANTWQNTLTSLNARFRLIAVDLPGHGLSEKNVPDYSAGWYLRFGQGLVRELGLDTFAVVGESAGGLLAAMLALSMPGQVSALALVSSGGLGREVSWSLRLASVPVVRRVITVPSRRLVAAFSRSLFYDPSLVTDEWVDLHYQLWYRLGVRETVLGLAGCNLSILGQRLVLLERIRFLSVPVAAFWGRQDRVIPFEHAYRLRAVRPSTRLHVYDRCGHMPQWERADDFHRDLANFLEDALGSRDT